MKKYTHLFATDMDYTLLLPGEPISEANLKAAAALEEAGVAFTLSTGRTSFLTGKYARTLNIKVPMITSNGGALYDYSQHRDIYSNDFTDETLRQLLDFIFANNVNATGYSTEGIFFAPESTRRDFIINYNSTEPDYDKVPMFELTSDILGSSRLPSFNKFLIVDTPDDVLAQLSSIPDLECVSSAPGFYDVMRTGATKGNALLRLADELGIPRANTIAIGDSDNDLSMLKAAGCSIAMGNSTAEVLAAATHVTGNCADDGFAQAVFDVILPMVRG